MNINQLNGPINQTDSSVKVESINLRLGFDDAWALCNMLDERRLKDNAHMLEREQVKRLMAMGQRLGMLIDHPSANNFGKFVMSVAAVPEAK